MRVVDSDVIGASGSPKDNIKHLQGAVRLIRRGTTDSNATLSLLNVFCLLALKVGNNKNLMNELDKSYIEGYQELKNEIKITMTSPVVFLGLRQILIFTIEI